MQLPMINHSVLSVLYLPLSFLHLVENGIRLEFFLSLFGCVSTEGLEDLGDRWLAESYFPAIEKFRGKIGAWNRVSVVAMQQLCEVSGKFLVFRSIRGESHTRVSEGPSLDLGRDGV